MTSHGPRMLDRILDRLGFQLMRRTDLEALQAERLKLSAELTASRSRDQDLQRELEALKRDYRLRREELDALQADRLSFREQLDRLRDERLLREQELEALRGDRKLFQEQLNVFRDELLAHQNHMGALRNDRLLLLHRIAELRALQPPASTEEEIEVCVEPSMGDHLHTPAYYPFPALQGLDRHVFEVGIVDVGAEPLDFEDDVYSPLTGAGPCQVVGFDPFIDPALSQLTRAARPRPAGGATRRVLPYFIGNGRPAVFHINRFTPTSSLFCLNRNLAEPFRYLTETCQTVRTVDVSTRRLDDVEEIEHCDFLKVDVQGSDYDVVANAPKLLERTLFVHIEMEFAALYEGQPLFGDIDALLRSHGFDLIDLVKMGRNNYRSFPSSVLRSRLLWADGIYMKDPERLFALDPPLLLRAAYIAHVNYRKYDLSAHLIACYDRRCETSHVAAYLDVFGAAGPLHGGAPAL